VLEDKEASRIKKLSEEWQKKQLENPQGNNQNNSGMMGGMGGMMGGMGGMMGGLGGLTGSSSSGSGRMF
jgi:hypothetical protein